MADQAEVGEPIGSWVIRVPETTRANLEATIQTFATGSFFCQIRGLITMDQELAGEGAFLIFFADQGDATQAALVLEGATVLGFKKNYQPWRQ